MGHFLSLCTSQQDVSWQVPLDSQSILEQFRAYLRVNHMSFKTEASYVGWVMDLIHYHHFINPQDMNTSHIESYLNQLVLQHNVDVKVQRSALSALICFFVNFLDKRLAKMELCYVKRRKAMRFERSRCREEKLQALFAAALLQAGYNWQTINVLLGGIGKALHTKGGVT